jgi:hypothetical protein
MRSALAPTRTAGADPDWQRFLDNLKRDLWGDEAPASDRLAPSRREERP